jgi:hypothetical protein
MNISELTLAVSHPHRSRTSTSGWGAWRMLWCVRERSRPSSPSQLWVARLLSPWDVIIYLFCTELLLYSKDVTFVSIPWFITCVRLGDTTTPLRNMLQPPSHTTSTQLQPTSSPTQVFDGSITRSRAKKLQQEVHALLYEFQLNANENFMLPKSCMLILLRFTKEEGQNISRANKKEELYPSQSSATKLSRRNSHIFWFPKAMKAHKYFLESSWSLVSSSSKADLINSNRKTADLL